MHTGTKFGKSLGRSTEKGSYYAQEMKAQPLAIAVTLPVQPHQNRSQHTSDAMNVDRAERCSLLKCFNCGKIGHTARNCKENRQIREAGKEEEHFPEQSQ
jgi:hypothetical protein